MAGLLLLPKLAGRVSRHRADVLALTLGGRSIRCAPLRVGKQRVDHRARWRFGAHNRRSISPGERGKALGLTVLASTEEEAPASTNTLEAVRAGVNTAQQGKLAQDTFTVELRPFEGVEYKYRVEKGGSMVYSWTATGDVGFDFHGEPDGAPEKFSESYGKGDARSASGVFIAPTSGVHGWFWENKGSGRVTITLTTSGFYTASTEYRDGERRQRTFGGK